MVLEHEHIAQLTISFLPVSNQLLLIRYFDYEIRDVCSVQATCKRIYNMVKNDVGLWKHFLNRDYPFGFITQFNER